MTDSEWGRFAGAVLWFCWGLFLAVWVLGALYNARRAPGVRTRGGFLQRWRIAIGITVVIVVNLLLPKGTWDPLTVHQEWLRAVGAVVLIAGTAFALWARRALGLMWTSAPAAKEGHELRTDGPYAIVRHPIYTAILAMFIGTALLNQLGGWLVALVIAVVLVQWKIAAEERLMTAEFPGAYEEYKRRVPQLIPRLRKLDRS
ncbi:methyltransferase family protein [Streptomyces sp. NPDC052396]|uniref:methyltransferase family protein n=1 Tax=Streptomyces sp. NPDC052396 TaxID=3365689 RepID=UPI0037CEC9AE